MSPRLICMIAGTWEVLKAVLVYFLLVAWLYFAMSPHRPMRSERLPTPVDAKLVPPPFVYA